MSHSEAQNGMAGDDRNGVEGHEVRMREGLKMFTLAAVTLERDVLLHDLTEDEQRVLVGAVLNAADRTPQADVLRWIERHYADCDMNHVDFRVGAYRRALEALSAPEAQADVERAKLVERLRAGGAAMEREEDGGGIAYGSVLVEGSDLRRAADMLAMTTRPAGGEEVER